ncbi:hypothetical protein ACHAW5_010519 [Stephanodiscus triporus]|uniref:Uncharacterized protein n=1 Tax=Stephanodiscus triporus TaxID=2934178 RepID=A0ABD3N5R3_9STRA
MEGTTEGATRREVRGSKIVCPHECGNPPELQKGARAGKGAATRRLNGRLKNWDPLPEIPPPHSPAWHRLSGVRGDVTSRNQQRRRERLFNVEYGRPTQTNEDLSRPRSSDSSVMMKLSTLLALLSVTSASAFVAPGGRSAHFYLHYPTTMTKNLSHAATVAAATLVATLASSPLAALAGEDNYVYGEVNAPGGLGLAPSSALILAPGEDAFNEMKERDEKKWGKK